MLLASPRLPAELIPLAPLPPEGSLWVNFEILSTDRGRPLPEVLRDIESGRLQADEATVNGTRYRRTSLALPLVNGDRREVVLLLAEEQGRMRMLGFHRIHRHFEAPQGHTIVFQSGPPNPLTGDPVQVPADTYTYLALSTALSGFSADRAPLLVHLWVRDGEITAADIAFDGKEKLEVLGTQIPALRIRVRAKSATGNEAFYWFAEAEPHTLLQYRGPGGFLLEKGDSSPVVLLRATASSEQVRKIFRD